MKELLDMPLTIKWLKPDPVFVPAFLATYWNLRNHSLGVRQTDRKLITDLSTIPKGAFYDGLGLQVWMQQAAKLILAVRLHQMKFARPLVKEHKFARRLISCTLGSPNMGMKTEHPLRCMHVTCVHCHCRRIVACLNALLPPDMDPEDIVLIGRRVKREAIRERDEVKKFYVKQPTGLRCAKHPRFRFCYPLYYDKFGRTIVQHSTFWIERNRTTAAHRTKKFEDPHIKFFKSTVYEARFRIAQRLVYDLTSGKHFNFESLLRIDRTFSRMRVTRISPREKDVTA